MIPEFLQLIIQCDTILPEIIRMYGFWVYLIMFVIIVFEEGLILAVFLPGASLIFVAGAAAAAGQLNLAYLLVIFISGAVIGSTLNYWLGSRTGLPVFQKKFPHLIREEYVNKTYTFFERYGGRTIFFARFIPVIRTFSPFLAGAGKMRYKRFILFNIGSAIIFSLTVVLAGYLTGLVPLIQNNIDILEVLVLVSTGITLVAMVYLIILGYNRPHLQNT
jgi:membrane-associated protein